jgi:hypothetical protein
MTELLGRIRRVHQLPLGGPIRQLLIYDDQFLLVKPSKTDGLTLNVVGATDPVSLATNVAALPVEAIIARRSSERAAKWTSMSPADWLATRKVVWNLLFADVQSARYGPKYNYDRLLVEDIHGKTRGIAWERDPNPDAATLLRTALGATLQPLKA